MKRISSLVVFALFMVAVLAGPAQAREFTVVATWGNLNPWLKLEQPFYEALAEKTGGKFTANVVGTLDQMSNQGTGLIRQMDDGIFDIVAVGTDYLIPDCAELAGFNLPMMALDVAAARKVADVYRPVMEELLAKKFNAKLLAVTPNPYQIIFSRDPMPNGLKSIAGKKVRAAGWAASLFVDALGGTGVTLPFGEVTQAMSRGVVDAAITGSMTGYSAKWYEVTRYLAPYPIGGWSYYVHVMNLDVWNTLDKEEQSILSAAYRDNIDIPSWELTENDAQSGVDLLVQPQDGKEPLMRFVAVTPEDEALARAILQNNVLPEFGKKITKASAQQWNDTIGKALGLAIK